MSWMKKLFDTYENCQAMIDKEVDEKRVPLLPICHTTQKAQIEIVIDGEGNFKRAKVVPRNEARTIIPCTESSAGRTSGPVAHPLCDKLQYVANDYAEYGGTKTAQFDLYLAELEKWCNSNFAHPKVQAVLKYVKKGTVIRDLIKERILFAGENGKLLETWDKTKEKNVPDIFGVLNSQTDAFVRWIVGIPDKEDSKVWKDNTLFDRWISYYSKTKKKKALCYVTGKEDYAADQHPKKIRNDGDGAKLISSNDSSGFTFKGRFEDADQACGVGFGTTQKAHSALRWLISRQGYNNGDQAIVAWATTGADIPKPTDDYASILGESEMESDEAAPIPTAQALALKFNKKIAGYGKELGDTTGIVVMGLDSASPGRMSISFYRELTGSDYIERISRWHETCAWIHGYRYIESEGIKKKRYISFIGAPAPNVIADPAYGKRIDDKLRKATVSRLLPCIIDGQPIPSDLAESAVRRACNRVAMEEWEWNKTLSIACALYKKYQTKEKFDMALDENRKTRDYLYGRLLAIADRLEGQALYKAKEKRDSNAARYMQLFAEHPFKTWRQIELSLSPSKARLGGAHFYTGLIDKVMCQFSPEDFQSDKPLSGEFLLGFHCQRAELWKKKPEDTEEIENEE